MGINYLENHGGVRRVRWIGLVAFFIACISMGALSPLLIYFVAPGAVEVERLAAFLGLTSGLVIFFLSLRHSFRMPLEKLPRPAGG